jgi:hypothetical protein
MFPKLLQRPGAKHPRFTGLLILKVYWVKTVGFYTVTYTYAGLTTEQEIPPVYQLQGTIAEEDIQLHPEFVEKLAGTPEDPKNGAQFVDPKTGAVTKDNEKGVFREFKLLVGGKKNPLAGVDGYLVPGVTWTKTYVSKSRPNDLKKLGQIDEPEGPNPDVSPRTWIYYSMDYTEKGGVFEIRKTWLMSDRRGWDENIYKGG